VLGACTGTGVEAIAVDNVLCLLMTGTGTTGVGIGATGVETGTTGVETGTTGV